MKRGAIIGLTCLLIGMIVGRWGLSVLGGGQAGDREGLVAPNQQQIAMGSTSPDLAPGAASSRQPVEAHQQDPDETVVTPAEDTSDHDPQDYYPVPTDEELEERYRDYSKHELVGASRGLEWAVHQDAKALLAEQFDRGEYEAIIMPVGETPERSLRAPNGDHLARSVKCAFLEDGMMELKIAELRIEEHPILNSRSQEGLWLKERLREKYGVENP